MVKKRLRAATRRRATMPSTSKTSKPGPGRPPVHNETWSKVSVVLFDRQVVHLDRLAVDIRGKSGRVLNRAEIIRALIDGLIDSGMDVTNAGSEADLRARVARRLGTPYR
jgi:hypothetical protein